MIKFSRKNKSRFVGCNAYPDCDQTYPLPRTGMIESTDKVCEHCNVPLISVRLPRKGPQELCINPDCPKRQEAMKEAGTEERPCKKCGKGTMTLRNGMYGPFMGCNRYPECKTIEKIPKE